MDSVPLDADGWVSSGIIEGLQMTTSNRINSYTDINRIDETRGSITLEGCGLSVNEKNLDRPTHTHHSYKDGKAFRKKLQKNSGNSCPEVTRCLISEQN